MTDTPRTVPEIIAAANNLLAVDRTGLHVLDRGRAAHCIRSLLDLVQQQAQEIERLTAYVKFKDELIWTSRVSELYVATVAAEKAQQAAEARCAMLREGLELVAHHADDEAGYMVTVRALLASDEAQQ